MARALRRRAVRLGQSDSHLGELIVLSRWILLAVLVFVQAPANALGQQGDDVVPRTTWGDPDLQGLWNNFTITPLERPAISSDQEFLSPEEAAALQQRAIEAVGRANAPSQVRSEPLPVGGNVGSYNSFWTEQGTRVVPTGRTSLIVDTRDGRLPRLTPEGLRRITSPENRRLFTKRMCRMAGCPRTDRRKWVSANGVSGIVEFPRFRPDTTTTITSSKHPTGS